MGQTLADLLLGKHETWRKFRRGRGRGWFGSNYSFLQYAHLRNRAAAGGGMNL